MVADASPEQLDQLADEAWWLGRVEDCIAYREAAYRLYDEQGDHRAAGYAAVWLYEHYAFRAKGAIASAWLQRARRALADDTESVPYGALVLREAEAAHGRGELAAAGEMAESVIALARRLRSADLEAEGLQTLGRLFIDQGRVLEGLAHLDEAMLFAVEGRLGPYSTGKVYCSLISACESLGDFRRAAEWTEATAAWAEGHPFAIFPGICRVHRATAQAWRGSLAEAEREALKAADDLMGSHLGNAAAAYVEIGDIRRRLGDFDGAEEAFAKAREMCGRTCAGLALLRLAQDRVDPALAIITSCMDEAGWNRLGRAKLLPAQVQIAIAAGNLEDAIAGVDELSATGAEFESESLQAAAVTARGRVQLATKDLGAAAMTLRDAVLRWQALDVPYEVATARTLLGEALRDADPESAAVEFAAADDLFEQIGARSGTATQTSAPAGLTAREVEVLELIANGLTNKEIAEALFLSAKTVSRHLSNIFTKIHVTSRAAATAFAFENNLAKRR